MRKARKGSRTATGIVLLGALAAWAAGCGGDDGGGAGGGGDGSEQAGSGVSRLDELRIVDVATSPGPVIMTNPQTQVVARVRNAGSRPVRLYLARRTGRKMLAHEAREHGDRNGGFELLYGLGIEVWNARYTVWKDPESNHMWVPAGEAPKPGERIEEVQVAPGQAASFSILIDARFNAGRPIRVFLLNPGLARTDERLTGPQARFEGTVGEASGLRIAGLTCTRIKEPALGSDARQITVRVENAGATGVDLYLQAEDGLVHPKLIERRRKDPAFGGPCQLGLAKHRAPGLGGDRLPYYVLWSPLEAQRHPKDKPLGSRPTAHLEAGETRSFSFTVPEEMYPLSTYRAFLLDPAGGKLDEKTLAP